MPFLHGITDETFDRLELANRPRPVVGRSSLPDLWVSDEVYARLAPYRTDDDPPNSDDAALNRALDDARV